MNKTTRPYWVIISILFIFIVLLSGVALERHLRVMQLNLEYKSDLRHVSGLVAYLVRGYSQNGVWPNPNDFPDQSLMRFTDKTTTSNEDILNFSPMRNDILIEVTLEQDGVIFVNPVEKTD